jgi:hypothetical protein
LLLTALLLGWSWHGLEGYQIADAVEYLERAFHLVRNEDMIDSKSIRAFGFSGLLVPLFAFAEALEALTGFENHSYVVYAARLLQIAMTLALVATTVRLGTVFAGRGAGYAAGLLLGSNPVILRYGVSPVSGIAAGLFVALAIELMVRDEGVHTSRRRGWLAGLALGGAIMMAYQSITVVAPIALVMIWPRKTGLHASRIMVLLGIATCLLAQCVMDKLYYGSFGESLAVYLFENVGPIAAIKIHRLAELIGVPALSDVAKWLYDHSTVFIDEARQLDLMADSGNVRSKLPRHWYVSNLDHALTIPGVALLVLGLARALKRRSFGPLLILVVFALNVFVMSAKGSKEYRLWLPFMALVAVLAGMGWPVVVGAAGSVARRALASLAVAALVVLGVHEHSKLNTRPFGAFWRAMSYVNEQSALERGPDDFKKRVSCSFHWALFLRESSDIDLIKLPKHLDHWAHYTEVERNADLGTLASLDWFIVHLPTLTTLDPNLMKQVNNLFSPRAVFFEREAASGLGPVFVMSRRKGKPEELSLYQIREGVDRDEWAAARGFDRPITFVERNSLTLLGVEFTGLPGDGHGWITYHWHGARLNRDYTLIDRITSPGSAHSWHNNHEPAYGIHPTSSWPEHGWILSESYLVVPEAEPFRQYVEGEPDRFIGGKYMRGDLVPGDLWMTVAIVEDHKVTERLVAVRPSDGVPVREIAPPGAFPTPDGWRTSPDGMTWVTSFLIPVSKALQRRSDG